MTRASSHRFGRGRHLAAVFAVMLALSLGLSACGRKAPPTHPEGAEYPKIYPQE